MLRRLVIAAVAAVCASTAVPAQAAAPAKLYLNQASDSCSTTGAQWAITNSPDDGGPCIIVPRLQYDGEGLAAEGEAFASSRKLKTYTLDASKPVTGSFSLFGSGPLTQPDGVALVAGEFTVKIARVKIGVVRVEGPATPTAPATATFSFKLPKSLNKVRTNSFSVTHEWITCIGLCGVKVSGTSFLSVPVR